MVEGLDSVSLEEQTDNACTDQRLWLTTNGLTHRGCNIKIPHDLDVRLKLLFASAWVFENFHSSMSCRFGESWMEINIDNTAQVSGSLRLCGQSRFYRPLGLRILGRASAIGSKEGNDFRVVLIVMISKRLRHC